MAKIFDLNEIFTVLTFLYKLKKLAESSILISQTATFGLSNKNFVTFFFLKILVLCK